MSHLVELSCPWGDNTFRVALVIVAMWLNLIGEPQVEHLSNYA